MNPVVHFELPADDRQRMADFYTNVFGWEAKLMGPEMGSYVTVATTLSDANGRPTTPGAINGGFFPKSEATAKYPTIVIQVDDIKQHMEKITSGGGSILGEPVEIPYVGWYVAFTDTEGNRIALLQPAMP